MIDKCSVSKFWVKLSLCLLWLLLPALADSGSDGAATFLVRPDVTAVLFVSGVVFWFLAVITFGAGVAEVGCLVSFGLLFAGKFLNGEALWLPLLLFGAGVLFTALELFVVPGFGICGLLSLVSFGALSILLMHNTKMGLTIFFGAVILSALSIYGVFRFLPKNVAVRRLLVLEAPKAEAAKKLVSSSAPLAKLGEIGETLSSLRPIGAVLLAGRRVEAFSEGGFIDKGQKVEVVRIEDQKIVVKEC